MILLTGYWDEDANLVIESSQEFPDGTSETELDAQAYRALPEEHKENGWACSFLVDSHSQACQMAYETYVREVGHGGPTLIDNVWGIQVDD